MSARREEHARPIRIAFIISGLTIGGAELMLWKLLSRVDRKRFDPFVITLSQRIHPSLRQRFASIEVPCHMLRGRGVLGAPAALLELRNLLSRFNPEIVQGWMYYGNIAATIAAMLRLHQGAVLWNVRGTLLQEQRRLTSLMAWLGGILSFSPAHIINNSEESALEHEERLGYSSEKRVVLPNGFDTELFTPADAAERENLRRALSLPADVVLVGLFGRYHPMKDHANFLHACALVRVACPSVHYILAGEDIDADNTDLTSLIQARGLSGSVHLLGLRRDVERVTAALDIAVSSSRYGEGFPNVIGEAMSCGVPCVVTDVGDSAWVVGDSGTIVPPAAPEALAKALIDLVKKSPAGRRVLGQMARQRVLDNFALDAVVRQYEDLYLRVHRAPGIRGSA